MKIGKFKKLLVSILVLSLSFGMMNAPKVVNAEAEESGIVLDKTATWNDDGTATIKLEAYATGKVELGSAIPLDIVLVLDQSGSMYTSGYYESLQDAVTNFTTKIYNDAVEKDVDHRVAIVGYASNEDDGKSNSGRVSPGSNNDGLWTNTGVFVNGNLINYERYRYDKIFSDSLNTDYSYYIFNNNNYIEVTYHNFGSWWNPDYCWGYFTYDTYEWNKVYPKTNENDYNIQFFTKNKIGLTSDDYQNSLVNINYNGVINSAIKTAIDNYGYSGGTRTSYGMKMAKKIFENTTNKTDDGQERERIVVVFTDGKPGKSDFSNSEARSAINESYNVKNDYEAKVYTIGLYQRADDQTKDFMNRLSSNYPNVYYENDRYQNNTKESSDYYYTTSNATGLDSIFQKIADDISSSNTELDETSIITDYISQSFKAPDSTSIEAYTVTYAGSGNWNTEKNYLNDDCIDINDRKIQVTGFSYKDNYVLDEDPQTKRPTGKKLVIEIKVKPIDGFIGGNNVLTNSSANISFKDEIVSEFPKPHVDIPILYKGIENDQTIYMGNNWNEIIQMIEDHTHNDFQYENTRNETINTDSPQQRSYTIDGKVNEYVDITYTFKDGNDIVGVYKIEHGSLNGEWDRQINLNSSELTECHEYNVDISVSPITSTCDNNDHINATVLNDNLTPTLHVLKPTVYVKDSSMSYGSKTNLNNNIEENIIWNNCTHNKGVNDISSGVNEPQYNISILGKNHFSNMTEEADGIYFIPQNPVNGQFEIKVENNGKDITDDVIVKNGNLEKNEFTVKVVSGSIDIEKIINDFNLNDGDPIFTFKIRIKNDLLENKTYYRTCRLSEIKSGNVETISGLPIGEYEITELETLKYKYDNAELIKSELSVTTTPMTRGLKFTITEFNLSKNNNFKFKFTNKLKSKNYDSDNDVLINRFVVDGDHCKVEQDKLN